VEKNKPSTFPKPGRFTYKRKHTGTWDIIGIALELDWDFTETSLAL